MALLEVHCEDCKNILGEPFEEVHLWLDEFFLFNNISSDHRQHRHNQKGVDEVRRIWGDKAAQAAEIHIMKDLDGIPKDSQDYLTGDWTKWRKA